MEKIFYTDKSRFSTSSEAVKEILRSHFNIENATIARTESGKPYLESPSCPLHFSVSHTKRELFIAFSHQNVGVDAELCAREVNYPLLTKKFPFAEREEIQNATDFLTHWTVKESAVKWLGEKLATSLRKLSFIGGRLYYDGLELPVRVFTTNLQGHILSVCGERDFSRTEIIRL